MGNLPKLKRIRKYLTLEASKTIALGLIITHLDYANALYAGLPDTDLQKLQRVQNMTAKAATGTSKYDSSTAALKTLHWLPIRLRIEFKILTLVFRCVHGQAPIYLSNLVNLKVTARRPGLRSGKRKLHLKVPFTKCKTFADISFSVYGPKMWKNLPDDIRAAVDIGTFKRKLKTWMFTRF